MIGILLIIAGVIAGLIGMCSDTESDNQAFIFIVTIILLIVGLILCIMESV